MTAITKARFMDGLVCWLPMAEGAGTRVNDQSKYGNNGVFGGTPSWVAGRDGLPSVSFDGIGDYVEIPDLPETDNGTVMLRFKPHDDIDADTAPPQVLYINAISVTLFLQINHFSGNGKVYFGYCEGGWNGCESVETFWSKDLYHGIAGVWGAGGLKIYVNGILSNSEPSLTGKPNSQAQVGYLGRHQANYASTILDETLIYNRILDPYEIRAHYEAARKI